MGQLHQTIHEHAAFLHSLLQTSARLPTPVFETKFNPLYIPD
jgi:hypothetical protein